jgi:hypothetical protein
MTLVSTPRACAAINAALDSDPVREFHVRVAIARQSPDLERQRRGQEVTKLDVQQRHHFVGGIAQSFSECFRKRIPVELKVQDDVQLTPSRVARRRGQQRDDVLRSLEEPIPDAVQAEQQVIR